MNQIQRKITQAFELFDQGKVLEAEKLYEECLSELSDDKSVEYQTALHGMGYVKAHLKKYEDARNIYEELLKIAEDQQNLVDQIVAIHQLGMVERMAHNYDEALAYFDKEYEWLKEIEENKQLMLAANYYEKGYIHFLKKDYEVAERFMGKSLDHAKASEDKVALGCAYRGLGEIHQATGRKKSADRFFERAIQCFKEVGDKHAVAEIEMVRKMKS